MCTYNGARFLPEQLESIAAQTRLPDELVVCDDGSTDETVEVIKAFAGRASFAVRLEINKERFGSTKNFEKAIGLCEGAIIALADQDDIWNPQKLATLGATLEDHPDAGYAFSDAELIDALAMPTGQGLWDSLRLSAALIKQFCGTNQFPILLRRTVVTGATMAFRASLKKTLLPISANFVHDYWVSLIASGIGAYGIPTHEKLIQYRQHDGQQIGAGSRSVIEKISRARGLGASQYNRATQGYLDVKERLFAVAIGGLTFPAAHMALLEEKIIHCVQRSEVHSRRGIGKISKICSEVLTGRYVRFSDSWRSVVRDLCF
jgi:glycosyltransferase involved in cell wall biosynthesis